jgi:hypothetical protein
LNAVIAGICYQNVAAGFHGKPHGPLKFAFSSPSFAPCHKEFSIGRKFLDAVVLAKSITKLRGINKTLAIYEYIGDIDKLVWIRTIFSEVKQKLSCRAIAQDAMVMSVGHKKIALGRKAQTRRFSLLDLGNTKATEICTLGRERLDTPCHIHDIQLLRWG